MNKLMPLLNIYPLSIPKVWEILIDIDSSYKWNSRGIELVEAKLFLKQEDHDGPISLTWPNRFAYLMLKFQPSSLL